MVPVLSPGELRYWEADLCHLGDVYADRVPTELSWGRPCHTDRFEKGSSLPSAGCSFLLDCKEIGPAGSFQQSKACSTVSSCIPH